MSNVGKNSVPNVFKACSFSLVLLIQENLHNEDSWRQSYRIIVRECVSSRDGLLILVI